MPVNAVFGKETSGFTKRLVHDVEAAPAMLENPVPKAAGGALKRLNPVPTEMTFEFDKIPGTFGRSAGFLST